MSDPASNARLFATLVAILIVIRCAVQLWLERLNRKTVLDHRDRPPDALRDVVDDATYRRSIDYTLAKSRLSMVESAIDMVLLLALLFSGILPWAYHLVGPPLQQSAWGMAGFLFAVGVVLSLVTMPLEWYAQFHLESRFGFNTTTPSLWIMDRVKGFLLALALGYPLLVLVLKLFDWTGDRWWIWAWSTLLAFQLVMMVAAPVLIMPLFNKFTPLPEGTLRERLLELARRTGFGAKSIQIMDGSKRSRHSNAFFTGFGRFRKIVLFDTLIQHLAEPELEAVLAHEIGHYTKRHVLQWLVWSALSALGALYVLAKLVRAEWFYSAFGLPSGNVGVALLLPGLLSAVFSFWFSPLFHLWSRRHEYQADAYAARVVGQASPLIAALRKLNEKNLSNLTPHPLYSGFYYSHPTLLERERALSHLAA
jgi:STE24 endopeptidase